jgi:hypothetical protein
MIYGFTKKEVKCLVMFGCKKSVAGWQWLYVFEVAAMYSPYGRAQCSLLS